MKKPKFYHETFAQFFAEPTREKLRALLKDNIGEFRLCEFKREWPEYSSLARHVLALANSGGGCLVVGVSENPDNTLEPSGLTVLTDKATITNGIKAYLSGNLLSRLDILDFPYEASEYTKLQGKKFQVLFVECDDTELPYLALKAGTSLRQNALYIRREGSSEEAGYEELQQVLNRRLETGYSSSRELDLKAELEQLRVLYSFLTRDHLVIGGAWANYLAGLMKANPAYPNETFDEFVTKLIEAKKSRIRQLLKF